MKKTRTAGILAALAAFALVPLATTRGADAPPEVEAQVKRGGELYGKNCAHCHGDAGQGTKDAPALVGQGALPLKREGAKKRTGEFKTAGDIAAFVVKNMPGDDPGSLKADEYYAILAFALKANGVALQKPVDGAEAAKIKLH